MAFLVPGVIALFALIATGGMTFGLIKARNRMRLIEAAPLCTADELITGLAKMKGKIMALDKDDLLISPMTGTRCVFFKFVVEEQRTRTVYRTERVGNTTRQVRRTETYWHPIVTDVQAVPTVLRDKTGDAGLDLTSSELTLAAMQAKSGTFNSVPASLERTLQKRYGVSSKGLIFNKNMRYTEAVLEQGAKVFVVGDCKIRKNGKPSFYKGDNPLLVTDRSEDELVAIYKRRFIGFMIGVILVPLILFGVAAGVGYTLHNAEKAMNPPKSNQEAKQKQTNKQNPQGSENPQNPPANDEISLKLADMKQTTDKWARVRAANDLAYRVPVQPQRRDEVASVIAMLLNDGDKDVRGGGIAAAKTWGTKRHNEAALKKLANSSDFLEKQGASEALATLAP